MYSPTRNNGQITQSVQSISGQTVTYQYDALKRVISAAAAPISGTTPAALNQGFTHDGFGNLTAMVANGVTTPIPVNAATNRLSNASYDANGNMTSGAGATFVYDEANRIIAAAEVSGGTEYYNYAPDGKRVLRVPADGSAPEWTFWGAHGEKLGTFNVTPYYTGNMVSTYYYSVMSPTLAFAGRKIWEGGRAAVQDRLGTVAGGALLPYGEYQAGVSYGSGTWFGTYWRDGFTGLDYADQRYYASSYGRFNSPDRATNSAVVNVPGSWNRYAYTYGDPINRLDPTGNTSCDANGDNCYDSVDVTDDDDDDDDPDYASGNNTVQPLGKANTIVVNHYSRTGAKETAIAKTLTLIQSTILGGNSDCASWLANGSAGFSASQFISAIMGGDPSQYTFGYANLNVDTTAAFVGNANANGTAVAGLPSDSTITVNANGAFLALGSRWAVEAHNIRAERRKRRSLFYCTSLRMKLVRSPDVFAWHGFPYQP